MLQHSKFTWHGSIKIIKSQSKVVQIGQLAKFGWIRACQCIVVLLE